MHMNRPMPFLLQHQNYLHFPFENVKICICLGVPHEKYGWLDCGTESVLLPPLLRHFFGQPAAPSVKFVAFLLYCRYAAQ